ncbi:MAG TPA: oligopeptide ABC transporter permease [Bacillus sp. (in: firmicutes)]|uniref:oligopeptide ABC transporter permease n=1 Tax=Bacillus litorisediminis TaxID=2922713 RepID=UPI001FAF5E13|nr:oligopeptide ABC transporter permease [Bacillus litorisediminis]HWO75417.1 oligopeptide ABC transporter permease [Bacillus sp. (in: firmicutes)]
MQQNLDLIEKDLFEPDPIVGKMEKKLKDRPQMSFWKDAWFRLRRNKGAIFSIFILTLITILAIICPYFSGHTYSEQNVLHSNLPPKIAGLEWLGFNGVDINGINQYEARNLSENYWFGTDQFGRDIWTRVWEGTKISLYIAFLAAALDLIIGVIYGGISGYFGGRIDNILQRIIEILVGIPNLILIILFILIFEPGIISITLAMVITGWVNMARVVRGQILQLKGQEFVLASRTLGANPFRLITKHLLPNTLGSIIVTLMFTIPTAIFFEAFLSFIGLGLQPPLASLGIMIDDGYKSMMLFPYKMIFPAVVISLIMICFNVLADGLRDALDPKMRK